MLDPQKDAATIRAVEAALNEAYLGRWDRRSAEDQLAIENEVFRRYNHSSQYAVPWVDRVAALAGREVVEIGCGTGSSTAAFARLAGHVHAYDIDSPFVDGAVARARVLGLTNVTFHAVPAVQLLDEIRRRHEANTVDLVLLFALLEHCTTVECLDTIRTSWEMLRPGGHLAVLETPNRLSYMDVHTTLIPFFHMLPGPVALRYYRRSRRETVVKSLDNAMRVSAEQGETERIRLGTGVGFHEFQIALGVDDLGPLLAADGYEPEMREWFPISLEERLLQTFFLARDVPAPIGFARSVINVILRKPRGEASTEPLIPLASRRNFIVNYDLAAPDESLQEASLAREFDAAGESLTVISASDSGLLTPANQVEVSAGRDHIEVRSTGHDPYFLLPRFASVLAESVMRIAISPPGSTVLQVFYATAAERDYAEEHSVRAPCYRGVNTLFVKLPAGVRGALRIDPGALPGAYRIYSIELRVRRRPPRPSPEEVVSAPSPDEAAPPKNRQLVGEPPLDYVSLERARTYALRPQRDGLTGVAVLMGSPIEAPLTGHLAFELGLSGAQVLRRGEVAFTVTGAAGSWLALPFEPLEHSAGQALVLTLRILGPPLAVGIFETHHPRSWRERAHLRFGSGGVREYTHAKLEYAR